MNRRQIKKTKLLRIRSKRRILKKQYCDYDALSKDMKSIIYQMEDDELEHLAFCINFDGHITEYVKDCLKSLRKVIKNRLAQK